MARSDRYRFGDILLPEAESFARTIPALLRQQQSNELAEQELAQNSRRISLAEKNAEEQRLFKERQLARQNQIRKEDLDYRTEQDKLRQRNFLVSETDDPLRKSQIYSSYGDIPASEYYKKEFEKQEDETTSIKSFYSSISDGDDRVVLEEASKLLGVIDYTNPAFNSVFNQAQQAKARQRNKYADMLKIPTYKFRYDTIEKAVGMPGADTQKAIKAIDALQKEYEEKVLNAGKTPPEPAVDKEAGEKVSSKLPTESGYADDLLNEDIFGVVGELEFLPEEEQRKAVSQVAKIEPEYDSLVSELSELKTQRQGRYENLESKKKDLVEAQKRLRYYARTKDKDKRKESSREVQNLQAEIKKLSAETSKLKQLESGFGTTTASDRFGEDFLGSKIAGTEQAINKLLRERNRLTGRPTYSN